MEFFMQFIDLINNLGGYVTIQADGIFLERFLNICTRRNLDIWDIRHCGAQRLTANMSLASFREIRPVCRRTRTRLQIIRRRGFPFFAHRYRKRKFALLGLALAIFILWYTSGHIMGITVFGNSRISTDTILTHLARSGVSLGETTEGIDSALIRNRMMGDLDDLAWIGINVSGSRIYVEVVERLETEPGVNMEQPVILWLPRTESSSPSSPERPDHGQAQGRGTGGRRPCQRYHGQRRPRVPVCSRLW